MSSKTPVLALSLSLSAAETFSMCDIHRVAMAFMRRRVSFVVEPLTSLSHYSEHDETG